MKYRPDVDGLRAVAVASVLVFHAFPALLPGGFIGVDIFFVISGYLISGIILERIKAGNFTFADFYARRIRRIFPALAIVLAATLAAGWIVLFPVDFARLGGHALAGAAFVANIAFWREAGYFDAASELKPLLHLWSLGVEEQFYLVWPVLLLLVARFLHRILWVIVAIALGSFALNILFVDSHPWATFYLPVTRFWELMLGSLLAYLRIFHSGGIGAFLRDARPGMHRTLLAAGGLMLIGTGLVMIRAEQSFPGWWALLPTLGTTLVIAAGPHATPNRAFLSTRVMVWLGLISYPLYLWHWPLLSLARIIHGEAPPVATRIALLAAAVALAHTTYSLVELRVRVHGRMRAWAVPAFSSAVVVVALVGGLAFMGTVQSASGRVPYVAEVSAALSDWDAGNNTTLPGDSRRAVLFFGDSHMQQYWPRIESVADAHAEPTRTVVFHARGGCAPIPGIERRGYGCPEFVDEGFRMASAGNVDTVVVAASWMGLRSRTDAFEADNEQRALDLAGADWQWAMDRLEQELARLREQGKTVVIVLSSPRGEELDPGGMLRKTGLVEWEVDLGRPLPRDELERDLAVADGYLRRMARRIGAVTVNPLDSLCTATQCPATSHEGEPLFRDASHIRASVVRESFRALDGFIHLPPG